MRREVWPESDIKNKSKWKTFNAFIDTESQVTTIMETLYLTHFVPDGKKNREK